MSMVAGILNMGRRQAEVLMTSVCVITREGDPVQNDDGSITPTVTTVYSGKCRLKWQLTMRIPQVNAEGQQLALQHPTLSLPMSVTGVRKGDLVTMGADDLDPDMAGLVLRVAGPFASSQVTARRFSCEVLA
jgi:hypothetical protein